MAFQRFHFYWLKKPRSVSPEIFAAHGFLVGVVSLIWFFLAEKKFLIGMWKTCFSGLGLLLFYLQLFSSRTVEILLLRWSVVTLMEMEYMHWSFFSQVSMKLKFPRSFPSMLSRQILPRNNLCLQNPFQLLCCSSTVGLLLSSSLVGRMLCLLLAGQSLVCDLFIKVAH